MNNISTTVQRESEDDHYYHHAESFRDGITGYGGGYTEESARKRAIADLEKKEKQLTLITPGWENSIESFLCRG